MTRTMVVCDLGVAFEIYVLMHLKSARRLHALCPAGLMHDTQFPDRRHLHHRADAQ